MSLKETDPDLSLKLHAISHIDDLTSHIINQVKTRGQYYRVKTFVDVVSVPVLGTIEELFRQSLVNRDLNNILAEKCDNLDAWKSSFRRDAVNQSEALIAKMESQLKSEVATFAEDHFKDKKAAKVWNELVAQKHLESQCEDVLNELAKQCCEKTQELSREIIAELTYYEKIINDSPVSIQRMHAIINGKRVWNWGMIAAEGGLAIAGMILWIVGNAAAGPVGWIALGVTAIHAVGTFLFSKFGNSADKARKKLEESLNKNVEEICESLKSQMTASLDQLIQETIEKQLDELNRIRIIVSQLSSTQRLLGIELLPRYQEECCDIVKEALKLMWNFLTPSKIHSSARIPGNSILISLENKKSISSEILAKLEHLMQERVICLDYQERPELSVKELFETIPEIVSFSDDITDNNYHVELSSATTKAIDTIRLAEQLCGTIIEYKVV